MVSWLEPSLVEGGLTNWNVTLILSVLVESIPKATTNAKLSILRASYELEKAVKKIIIN